MPKLYIFLVRVYSIQQLNGLLIPVECQSGILRSTTPATYIVNTIPPLKISLANRGTAPDQKVKTPSFLKILAAQTRLFLYSFLASIDCILPNHKLLGCQVSDPYRLPGLDHIEGLSNISKLVNISFRWLNEPDLHRDQSRKASYPKRTHYSKFLSRLHVSLSKLLDHGVTPKPRSRIGRLPRRSRYETLEESPDSSFPKDDTRSMHEASHPWVRQLSIIDPMKILNLKTLACCSNARG